MRPTKAVAYLRVSTDEQAGSGLGLEAQRAAVRAWAGYRGMELVAFDLDVCSRGDPAGRPLGVPAGAGPAGGRRG